MKKAMALIFMLLLLCMVTACSNNVPAKDMPGTTSKKEVRTNNFTFQVKPDVQADTITAENGTKLASYRFQLPSLVVYENEKKITKAYTNTEKKKLKISSVFNRYYQNWCQDAGVEKLASDARSDYQACRKRGETWQGAYAEELTFSSWQTEHLISIRAVYYSFTGSLHPNTILISWNFNLDSGKFMEPTEIAKDSTVFRTAVQNEIIRQMENKAVKENKKPTDIYWEDYAEIAANWADYAVSFGKDGMTIGFSRYEIASYAEGDQVFTVNYEFLRPYLSPSGQKMLQVPKSSK